MFLNSLGDTNYAHKHKGILANGSQKVEETCQLWRQICWKPEHLETCTRRRRRRSLRRTVSIESASALQLTLWAVAQQPSPFVVTIIVRVNAIVIRPLHNWQPNDRHYT